MPTMSTRAANVNVGVAAKFRHRDAGGIGEQGVKRDRWNADPLLSLYMIKLCLINSYWPPADLHVERMPQYGMSR